MEMVRQVVVFDAADLHAESSFWAGVLGGRVFEDERWHTVIDSDGLWRIGVQLAPDHAPPHWPNGSPQQIHLDLHVENPRSAHEHVTALGATVLQAAPDLGATSGFQVYADPAGHPFCIGWGHPSPDTLARFVARNTDTADPSRVTGRGVT
jgi:predicted enzyme related to lactoylglutathione lyase